MKNTNTKKTNKTTKANICDCSNCEVHGNSMVVSRTAEDFKNTLLIVSVGINTFFLIGWLTLQVTNHYSTEAVSLIIR